MSKQIVFSHANGFPTACYNYFFDQFPGFDIDGIPMSGIDLPDIEVGWEALSDELIAFIENKYTEPVIGLGHSMGAVFFLFAANKRPDLFEQIILMDPPIMGNELRKLIEQKQREGTVHEVLSVAQKAKIRKDVFPSLPIVQRVMRGKGLFKQFHPECFDDYINAAYTQLDDKRIILSFPKELEYAIFCTIPSFSNPLDIKIPVKYIFATSGEIFESRSKEIEELKDVIPSASFTPFNGGHLFPFEQPSKVAKLVIDLINE